MDDCEDIYREHYNRRVALGVAKRGNVVAPAAILDALPESAFKVRDWRDGTAPATKTAVMDVLAALGAHAEVQFDAAHGRRYRVCMLAPGDRAAVVSFGTWPADND